MAQCAHCKTEETELYEYGVPVCLKCANIRAERSHTEDGDTSRRHGTIPENLDPSK